MIAPLARILIVDDESASMQALCDTLRDQGYETAGFTSAGDALQALQAGRFDLLLTDLMMPETDGVALLSAALKIDPQLVGILMTGNGTIETAVQAMKMGALDYVLKPIKLANLLPVLARAVAVRRLRQENMELRDTVAIQELNLAIAHTLDVNVLLDKIVDAALAQFDADEASIMLAEKDGQFLRVAAVRGEQREALLGTRVPIGESIAGWVASRREPQVLEGEAKNAPAISSHPRPEIQSALSMPMMARNKLIGILNVNCLRQRRAFTLGQIKALSIFANTAAAGIEAARLHDEQRRTDARYREVLGMAADAIVSIDANHRIVIFNRAAEQIFGYPAAEALGKPIDLLIPERFVAAHQHHAHAFEAGPVNAIPMQQRKPFFARRKDGTEFPAEISISKMSEAGGRVTTAVVRDVAERILQEQKIARLTRLYAALSEINSAIVRIGEESSLFAEICRVAMEQGQFMGAYVGKMVPVTNEVAIVASAGMQMEGRTLRPDTGTTYSGLMGRALEGREVVWNNDLVARPEPGTVQRDAVALGARAAAALPFLLDDTVWAIMIIHASEPDAFGNDEVQLLRELAGDVSFALDHIAKTGKVSYLATHDQLTGLPNRALFLDRLGHAVSMARSKNESLALVLTDVERFKHVNDTFGRRVGDAMLQQVACRFRNSVEDGTSLARVGADVFAQICTDFSQPTGIAKIVRDRMDRVMDEAFMAEGQALNLSARAGVAIFPGDGADAETLYHNAEAALKRAKVVHERVGFYTSDLNARVSQQLAMESKLLRALERNEFVLHYQPKVDLASGAIVGLEALIRWHDREKGLVPPTQFIGLLEETGLILEVGRWAMEASMRAVSELRAKGMPPISIAANVSPLQLRDKAFVRSVEEAIAAAGGSGNNGLDLEITESVIMQDIEGNVRKLAELQEMGVGLAIDDFGTGYSSLAYIARLPVDVIKIDRAFISSFHDNADNMAIVQMIISLTHALNRKVVAEGVETEEQARLLRLLRCDQYQGYLKSRPLPLADIEAMLRAHLPRGS